MRAKERLREREGKRGEQASGAERERALVCLVINSSADLTERRAGLCGNSL